MFIDKNINLLFKNSNLTNGLLLFVEPLDIDDIEAIITLNSIIKIAIISKNSVESIMNFETLKSIIYIKCMEYYKSKIPYYLTSPNDINEGLSQFITSFYNFLDKNIQKYESLIKNL